MRVHAGATFTFPVGPTLTLPSRTFPALTLLLPARYLMALTGALQSQAMLTLLMLECYLAAFAGEFLAQTALTGTLQSQAALTPLVLECYLAALAGALQVQAVLTSAFQLQAALALLAPQLMTPFCFAAFPAVIIGQSISCEQNSTDQRDDQSS
jgi:hypothetical protein